MQNRTSILSFILVAAGTAALLATTAQSQLGAPKNNVTVQPTTPGTSQSGHSNVSGTSKAGQFVGGGAGLTNVNAATLGGLPSSAFLQSIPVPFVLSGSSNHIVDATTSSTASFSAGVFGENLAASGFNYGVLGINNSDSGAGVRGNASNPTGSGFGVSGATTSPTSAGVHAVNNNLSVSTELAGPKGGVWTNGHYYRQFGSGERHAVEPIAFGTVRGDGVLTGSTGNCTVVRTANGVYQITVDGETYDPTTTCVMLTNQSATGFIEVAGNPDAFFYVVTRATNGVAVNGSFNFVVYKMNPDTPNDGGGH